MMCTMNSITKTIVLASAICPASMPLHNSFIIPVYSVAPTNAIATGA